MNGGTCELQDDGNNFNCICTDGFSGLRCESGKDIFYCKKQQLSCKSLLIESGMKALHVSLDFHSCFPDKFHSGPLTFSHQQILSLYNVTSCLAAWSHAPSRGPCPGGLCQGGSLSRGNLCP